MNKFPLQREMLPRLLLIARVPPWEDKSEPHPLSAPLQVSIRGRKFFQVEEEQRRGEKFQRQMAGTTSAQLGGYRIETLCWRQTESGESWREWVVGRNLGLITEAMGIHPTPHIPKTDSGAVRTGTEVGRCEQVLLGAGEVDGTR